MDADADGEVLAIDDSTTLWDAGIRDGSDLLQYCHFNIFFEDLEGRTIELELREIDGLDDVRGKLSARLAARYPDADPTDTDEDACAA